MTEIDEISINDLSTLCRICAKPTNSSIDLFNAEHNDKKYVEMLVFCFKQIIHENDGLPRFICGDCGSNLVIVHEFHRLYNDTEQHFRQILSSAERKVKVEIELDEPSENQIKVESESEIVVLPDISYFRDELQNVDSLKYSYNSNLSFRSISAGKISKKSKKLTNIKKSADKSQRLSAERQKLELFECFQCKKCFTRFGDLQRHASSHLKKVKPYECSECSIKFVYLKSLFRHRRQKHSDRVYECEYCTEAFESLSKLKQHVNGAHKNELKTYKCDSCSKTFILHFQLACHQSEDLCSQDFSCSICDDSFPLHRMLKSHIRDKHTSKSRSDCLSVE